MAESLTVGIRKAHRVEIFFSTDVDYLNSSDVMSIAHGFDSLRY